MRCSRLSAALFGLLGCLFQDPVPAPITAPGSTDYTVERDGQAVVLGRRGGAAGQGRSVAVFLHGGTWSGRPDFDLQVPGYSAMENFACAGMTAYCVDVQGYGQSANPLGDNWSDAANAVLDVLVAVDFIRGTEKVAKVHIVGWSWGSQVGGHFAAQYPDRVDRLVLYGTRYQALEGAPPVPTERYRTNDEADARSDFVEGCYDASVADAFVQAALDADPDTPNGVLLDYFANLPILVPAKLSMPTLVIAGEHEASHTIDDMALLFTELAATDKRLVVIPGGGHGVHLESGKDRWTKAVLDFLGD